MYFGQKEIKEIKENVLIFTDDTQLEIVEKNKELITEKPLTATELNIKWANQVAEQMIDILFENNVRTASLPFIIQAIKEILEGKENETLVKLYGKDKLDVLSQVFGSTECPSSVSIMNIRMQDIFKS